MIIDDVQVEMLGWGNARLSWVGDPDAVAHVFVNGRLAIEPQLQAVTEKSVVVGMPDPFAVEVHEAGSNVAVVASSIPLERRPSIWWSPRDGADLYRIYYQPDGDAERVIGEVAHSPNATHYEFVVPVDLRRDGKRWGYLRVESVSAAGEQSARPQWSLFMASLPAAPENVTVTGGGGMFDIALETSL
jgi:hypothetical protein